MRRIIFCTLILVQIFFCQQKDVVKESPENALSISERVNNLIGKMTLEEKISQMSFNADAIPRLNIPEYNWWNECLHGVARAGIATVFPQAIGLAATWNTNMIYRVADVTSTEARAKHHEFVRKGERSIYQGLTFWTPNINIFRDPRWGRGQETYGEDPFLTSRIGVAFIKGLQGDDPDYFKVIATPKHYVVHSGPEPERHVFDAVINSRDLYDTYLPAFEACVKEAKAYSVMCAYNRFMGEACCASPSILQDILRGDWNFQGYIVSDCWAINDIYANHKIVETAPEAAALTVKSGTDLNCGSVYKSSLLEAVNKGLLSEEDIDISVRRLFTARFKLGMFDSPEKVSYSQIPIEKNDSEEHRELSCEVARESIVLLKNEKNILPLKKDLNRIAVIGPNADSYQMLLGNYNGTPSKHVTLLEGIKNKTGEKISVVYEKGCNLVEEGTIINDLASDIFNYDGTPGLRAEYFKNRNLEGEPFYTAIDAIINPNLIYGTRQPNLRDEPEYSIRWSGSVELPEDGIYNFRIKGSDGFRLIINNEIVLEDWTENESSAKSGAIKLEGEKAYDFSLEYFQKSGRAGLTVQWELLEVDNFQRAMDLAKNSDVIIFAGGISPQLEGEEMEVDAEGFRGGDRTNIELPKVQEKLLKLLNTTGKPVVLVLCSGSAIAANWADSNIPTILQIWYPGQEGGTALADVLFGDYNPAGRLPVTFYKSAEQLPPFENYDMKGRTYRYFEDEPLYPFGFGMSYSKFEYSNLQVPDKVESGESIKIIVDVKNVSEIPGDEVVQLYVKDLSASVPVPIHSLQGFTRIHLKNNEQKQVEFTLTPRQLAIINNDNEYIVEPGLFNIYVGGNQPGYECSSTQVIMKQMEITGSSVKAD